MIEPTKRRLTWLFTALLAAVAVLLFGGISAYYHVGLVRHLEGQLGEEIMENIVPYAEKGDWSGVAQIVDTELFQVLDAQGNLVEESKNPLDVDPPINPRLLKAALAGLLGNEQVELGGKLVLVVYVPVGVNHVGRAVSSLDVLIAFDRNVGYLGVLGFPVVLALAYVLSRLIVARVMVPIHDVFTYQQLFSANVCHELRSPLTALKGGMEVALRRERSAEDYRGILSGGLQQVDRIVDLLNDLEMLASARFRPADLLREPVDLSILVEQCIAAHQASPPAQGPHWRADIAPGVTCSADRLLVRRVLENLLDNAAKYGLPDGEVRVELRAEPGLVRLCVANPCNPLAAEARAKLFEPFSRAPGARLLRVPGRGLGLYLARYIARSHGGDLILEPGPEAQFRVTLALPLKPQPPGKARQA